MSALLSLFRRWGCAHEAFVEEIRRTGPREVRCTCTRCGATLRAAAAIDLPASLRRRA
ncbi:MAG: hypothetical protein RLZZ524_1649 [Pseudomonadota bacterium]|jgi:hypothetical protein